MADGTSAAPLAALIDADNTPASAAPGLIAEIAKYGTAHVKRAYGNWDGTRRTGDSHKSSSPSGLTLADR
jgi:hypothetical protein